MAREIRYINTSLLITLSKGCWVRVNTVHGKFLKNQFLALLPLVVEHPSRLTSVSVALLPSVFFQRMPWNPFFSVYVMMLAKLFF